jgi:hypothetical protein
MRGLFRNALALVALGLGMIGCSSSRTPEDSSEAESGDPALQAAFRVPGMT